MILGVSNNRHGYFGHLCPPTTPGPLWAPVDMLVNSQAMNAGRLHRQKLEPVFGSRIMGKPEIYLPDREKVQIRAKADRLGCMSQSILALARAIGAHPRGSVYFLLPPFAASRNR